MELDGPTSGCTGRPRVKSGERPPVSRARWADHRRPRATGCTRKAWRRREPCAPLCVMRSIERSLGTLVQDLRYAVRLFARRRALTAVAVLSVAVATGPNAALARTRSLDPKDSE